MDLQYVRGVWYITLLFILKLFIDNSCSVSLTDLSRICCIDDTLRYDSLPSYNVCTAIATYSLDTGFGSIREYQSLRGNLPFVVIDNKNSFKSIRTNITSDKIDKFINDVSFFIRQQDINVFVIDNMNPSEIDEQDSGVQSDIQSLFKRLKSVHPDVLFGLTLPIKTNIIPKAFNRFDLDKVIDLYLVKTHSYHRCDHKNHQKDMPINSPVEKMQNTLTTVNDLGYTFDKMIYIIKITVETIKSRWSSYTHMKSYTYFCNYTNPGRTRKFCLDTLDNFYEKGKLMKTYKIRGMFIQSVDRDDHNATCSCGEYPVLRVIDAGAKGLAKPEVANCKTFGLLPRDRD